MTSHRGAFIRLPLLVSLLCCSVIALVHVKLPDQVDVLLGETARLPCHYRFKHDQEQPEVLMFQWFVRAVSSKKRIRLYYGDYNLETIDKNTNFTDRIHVERNDELMVLIIRDVRISDDMEFMCQVNGLGDGVAEATAHLRVFAIPKAPVIDGIPEAISTTNKEPSKVASCEVQSGFPKPSITWFRNNKELEVTPGHVKLLTLVSRDSIGLFTVQSTLEYKVQREDESSYFTCEVTYLVPGNVSRVKTDPITITVHYPTTMVEMWKETPPGLVKEGDTVELRCQGDGNPSPVLVFSKEQEPEVVLQQGSRDMLILHNVTRQDSSVYCCHSLDMNSEKSEVKGEVLLTVHYLDLAVVVPKDTEVMLKGEDLIATCNALSSLKTETVWFKDGKQVGVGSTLQLQDASYETSGEYICEVAVSFLPSMRTSGSVNILVQGSPELVGAGQEVQLEETAEQIVNLRCDALGNPAPTISWSIAGSQVWQEVESKSSDHKSYSVVSVKVTSDVIAQCNASNSIGMDMRVFSIRAIPMEPSTHPLSSTEGSGVIIVVIILGLLLVAVLGSVSYFLYKKGKIPSGRTGKQDISNKEKTTKDQIVVEMRKNSSNVDIVLLKAVNGEQNSTNGQVNSGEM